VTDLGTPVGVNTYPDTGHTRRIPCPGCQRPTALIRRKDGTPTGDLWPHDVVVAGRKRLCPAIRAQDQRHAAAIGGGPQ
jgi:hypothetical protein